MRTRSARRACSSPPPAASNGVTGIAMTLRSASIRSVVMCYAFRGPVVPRTPSVLSREQVDRIAHAPRVRDGRPRGQDLARSRLSIGGGGQGQELRRELGGGHRDVLLAPRGA